MIDDTSLYYLIILFFVLACIYVLYKSGKYQKKAFDHIQDSLQLCRETLETDREILQELRSISKKLDK